MDKRTGEQFMACGACGILVDENGHVTTPFEIMARDVKRIKALFARNRATRKASSVAHA